jgi:hypothetical protein
MVLAVRLIIVFTLVFATSAAQAAPAPFDLAGPKLRVEVTRAGRTLPIGQVPNLAAGDQLRIRAELPAGQSVHYLLVAAFLRGATNPPPASWFSSLQTWKPRNADGLRVTVPLDAQQMLVFMAPETGGDFKAIVGAVRGRPGAFVRASQDLDQASLDRGRLDAFLAAVRKVDQSDPDHLKTISPLLARSLTIKLEAACLDKAPEARAPCLTQGQDSLVLDDGHSTSMVQALTSGYSADLVQQLSATPRAGSGYYSPYIASVMDIAHIMDGFRTAQYQYIPALASQQDDQLSLLLNAPPSFQNPKSVLLAALPAIEPPRPPPLRPVDPAAVNCLEKPGLVLPAEGAPLAFSSGYAHDMVLRLKNKAGRIVDLPARADAAQGGFVVDTAGLDAGAFDNALDATLRGEWGFDAYDGPVFHLQSADGQAWRVAADDHPLIAGRDSTVRLQGPATACVEGVSLRLASGGTDKLDWKPGPPGQIAITANLKDVAPGPVTLLVKRWGAQTADAVALQAYAPLKSFDRFTYHLHDGGGVLKGGPLEAVATLTFGGVEFRPDPATPIDSDQLDLVLSDPSSAAKLRAGQVGAARIRLKDGRTVALDTQIEPPRPGLTLISKSLQPGPAQDKAAGVIQLTGADDIPRGAVLTFSVRAQATSGFSGREAIEVATVRGAFSTTLNAADGGLTLEDSQVALASLDTGKAFNASAAGPLRFRLVADGVAGDWQPLGVLVRLPILSALDCPDEADKPCRLTAANLFLIDSLSADPTFANPVAVPEGFPGDSLAVPHPIGGKLYMKLRDDPAVVNTVTFAGA